MKIGRNDPCHCGSGQKYKKCHLPADEAAERAAKAATAPAVEAPVAEAPAGDAPAGERAAKAAAPVRPAGALGGRAKLPPAPPPAPARRRAV
jgi:methionyl aminopeptidase